MTGLPPGGPMIDRGSALPSVSQAILTAAVHFFYSSTTYSEKAKSNNEPWIRKISTA
jgi:hypothetical protein